MDATPLKRLIAALAMTAVTAAQAHLPDDDPFLWLEDVRGEKALAWVNEQNAKSRPAIESHPGFKPLLADLTAIVTSRDRIPAVAKYGGHLYNFWQDAKNPRGLWRRTTAGEYRKAEPKWETVLDLDQLSAAEGEKWAWKGGQCLYPKYERCLLSLSRGGSDAVEIREFDLVKKAFVEGGFQLPESKGAVAWIDENTIYAARDFGPGTMTRSGYPRQVKRVARGQPVAQAPVVFEVAESDVGAWPTVVHEPSHRVETMTRAISVRTTETFVRIGDGFRKLDLPTSAETSIAARKLYVRLREDWKPAGIAFEDGTLLTIDLEAFLLGDREFEVLFTPGSRMALYTGSGALGISAYTPLKSMVLLNVLDNAKSRLFEVKRGEHGKWVPREVAVPAFSTVTTSALDRRESDDYQMFVTGFTTPTTLYFGKGGTDAREKMKSTPAFFDAKGLVVTQHEATSKDGTRIPYFQVMRASAKLDGRNPTILYGYGGFEVSQLPSYSGFIGKGWLEKGGTWVLANLRGGGEFGPEWNLTARREGRQKTHDDFAAVAEDLIRRKVTSPPKLAIFGGSQGGLLVGATLLQRPELFGAAVATVPLFDMKRYHKLLAGASWMGEYGDPDDPADWAFLSKYSPYQNVRKDAKYPPFLITTSTHDDRVHPGHARKMAALMQSYGHPATYFEYTEGGHGSGTTPQQSAYTWALIYTWFAKTLL
jgi:prolyl oligopeptidase